MTNSPSPGEADDPWRPPPDDHPGPDDHRVPGAQPDGMHRLGGQPYPYGGAGGTPEDTVSGPAPLPPGYSPMPPPERPSGPPFWLGVLAGVISPVVFGVLLNLFGDVSALVPLLFLGVTIAGLVHPRTRRFTLGALTGLALLLIIAAGACAAFIAMLVSGAS